ncbi:MAG: molybdopterin-dependent oxidoreductase [Limimaricola soesokkakensis]|uniref:molybdopterin-dependent oxidoreductase n=1 Tax=Limimaricola soesokkakensis TaxID=1343159 RepID=UPI004057F6D4
MLKALTTALTISCLSGLPAAAQPGSMALSVTGPDRSVTMLDLAALDAMPQESFVTGTIWTDGDARFSGVPLAALLERLGVEAEAGTIELVALNDYRVEIPIEEIDDSAPIVATRIDGETVPVREMGPYWVVYPYDLDPRYRTEATFARSIWQLAQVNLVP